MRTLENRIQINASHAVVWGILGDFSGVATWAPPLRNSAPVGDVEAGAGAYRVMRHFWGFRLEETVVEWDEGNGFRFDVVKVPFPLRDVRESWHLADGEGQVQVTTRVEYDMYLGPLGAALDAAFVSRLVRREMKAGRHGLQRSAETVMAKASTVASDATPE